jgi:hypothetical protein
MKLGKMDYFIQRLPETRDIIAVLEQVGDQAAMDLVKRLRFSYDQEASGFPKFVALSKEVYGLHQEAGASQEVIKYFRRLVQKAQDVEKELLTRGSQPDTSQLVQKVPGSLTASPARHTDSTMTQVPAASLTQQALQVKSNKRLKRARGKQ